MKNKWYYQAKRMLATEKKASPLTIKLVKGTAFNRRRITKEVTDWQLACPILPGHERKENERKNKKKFRPLSCN